MRPARSTRQAYPANSDIDGVEQGHTAELVAGDGCKRIFQRNRRACGFGAIAGDAV